ncbi:MAG: helix-turn-helix transcriptional regulator [Deltaproteobacteria bacterium]|nr:helix-turn-helix transcriptional regulator [Deltaproteobacteria bacterium]
MPNERTLECDGSVVRNLRLARGLSQFALAAATRTRFLARTSADQGSLSTIKRIERGKGVLAGKVEAVASVLGVPVTRLLSRGCRARLGRAAEAPRSGDTAPVPRATLPTEITTTIRLTCEARFRKILVDDHQLVLEGRMPGERYWRSYWYHQWDQFRYWKDGVLDDATFRAWMRFRHLEYRDNPSAGGIDYRTGWQQFAGWANDAEFSRFMESVFREAGHSRDGSDDPWGSKD